LYLWPVGYRVSLDGSVTLLFPLHYSHSPHLCAEIHLAFGNWCFWRFIQGLGGGGALITTSQTILTEIYPKEKLGMASAFFGMGIILGPTLGPFMGGYIIDHFEWPMLFYVNVPVGILATFLTVIFIKNNPFQVKQSGVDWLGIILLIIGIGSLQFVLEQGERNDWFESRTIVIGFIVATVRTHWFCLARINHRKSGCRFTRIC
jgi:DHA2 family multidrug resistance protein